MQDLYKYDVGNDYPCWDVLHECSADNSTAGTKDIFNEVPVATNCSPELAPSPCAAHCPLTHTRTSRTHTRTGL
jgi:hypothetical protein